jgi:processing peptidase subunit alpha
MYDPWELDEAKPKYKAILQEKLTKPETQVMEAIHAAAYNNNTLGLPLYPSQGTIDRFDQAALKTFFNTFFIPQRMVISGVGVDHAELVGLVRENFKTAKVAAPKVAQAQYTGGEVRVASDAPSIQLALAFETASWNSKDLVPMCVLQMLMGGGGSFSAGGPGKGMYSRLYTNVLNQHDWVESATCFNSMYSDSSLFGILGTCQGEQAGDLVDVLCAEFEGMRKVDSSELERAKAQLSASIQMQLETRTAQVEDQGRQVLSYNKVDTPEQLCAQINAVTVADVQRVAESMLKTRPAIASFGNVSHTRPYDEVSRRFR